MDATTTVAVAGLAATTLLGVVSPFLQGRIAARNARQNKSHDLAIAAYTDAMAHVQHVETSLVGLADVTARRHGKTPHIQVDLDLISARIRLVAPQDVLTHWSALLDAEHRLWWHLRESPHSGAEFELFEWDADQQEIVQVRRTAKELSEALRKAVDAPAAKMRKRPPEQRP